MPESVRSLAPSGPEWEVKGGTGSGMGLLKLSPKADCAHALGALCMFRRGFSGDTWEKDCLCPPPPKASWDGSARVRGWEKRKCECVCMSVLGRRRRVAQEDLIFLGLLQFLKSNQSSGVKVNYW